MGLIKADSAPLKVQPFSMADIENQANQILEQAKRKADRLEAAAQEQAKKILKDAHTAGLRGGWTEGWKKGQEEGAKAGKEQALNENKTEFAATVAALTVAGAVITACASSVPDNAASVAITPRVPKISLIFPNPRCTRCLTDPSEAPSSAAASP